VSHKQSCFDSQQPAVRTRAAPFNGSIISVVIKRLDHVSNPRSVVLLGNQFVGCFKKGCHHFPHSLLLLPIFRFCFSYLDDDNISDEEHLLILNERTKFNEMKEEIRSKIKGDIDEAGKEML
jgi:hypothetical protein